VGPRARRSCRELALLGGIPALVVVACARGAREERVTLAGDAMGTTWEVTLLSPPTPPAGVSWRSEIEAVLARVDAEMSTWRRDSELSRFNAARDGGWFSVSEETALVVGQALDVSRRTDGAFDPTVGPLVALWGFGPAAARAVPPDPSALSAARARVDAGSLVVRAMPPALQKRIPDLEVDLSAIAKGYGVDAVAERLRALGSDRFLVEIGGELRCSGAGPHAGAWRVAIDRPLPASGAWQRVLRLETAALATSGTYRNYREVGGERRPHVIDPRTGEPIRHDLVSVTVVSPTASLADAFATGLLVLGPESGLRVAQREGLAAFFVIAREGQLTEAHSPAFAPYLAAPEALP
jgi:thiamine biosynthesis lipoprotein